ncbi:hypothetical protein RB608_25375 [Nocardioides sp. LHD-245]|uniref:hypothetical protein n=1 Tax=Nocardioides sp. LHD-245 TaxID=3051387 RepID=UPI0027DFB22C|nr:hypothetical protein [Nocardioides sp. LHD-245]
MTLMKRPLATAGATVLLALSLAACGGGAPSDASVDDFCNTAADTLGKEFMAAYQDKDYDKLEDIFKKAAEKAADVGTPEDIPDDAREGFELQLDAYEDLDADDIKKGLEAKEGEDPFADEFSKDEMKKVEAFTTYQAETCADVSAPDTDDLPETDLPETDAPETDLPDTDLPTDGLPSGFPSDMPTTPEELESYLSDMGTQLPEELKSLLEEQGQ